MLFVPPESHCRLPDRIVALIMHVPPLTSLVVPILTFILSGCVITPPAPPKPRLLFQASPPSPLAVWSHLSHHPNLAHCHLPLLCRHPARPRTSPTFHHRHRARLTLSNLFVICLNSPSPIHIPSTSSVPLCTHATHSNHTGRCPRLPTLCHPPWEHCYGLSSYSYLANNSIILFILFHGHAMGSK
jgi:hypothetical protein